MPIVAHRPSYKCKNKSMEKEACANKFCTKSESWMYNMIQRFRKFAFRSLMINKTQKQLEEIFLVHCLNFFVAFFEVTLRRSHCIFDNKFLLKVRVYYKAKKLRDVYFLLSEYFIFHCLNLDSLFSKFWRFSSKTRKWKHAARGPHPAFMGQFISYEFIFLTWIWPDRHK